MAYNLEKKRPSLHATFYLRETGVLFPFVFLAHQIDLPKTHHKEMKKQLLQWK